MKIGWVSAPAHAKTGYGRQTKEICSRLVERCEVVNIGGGERPIWGGKFNVVTEKGQQFTVLPTMGRLGGGDVVPHYHKRFSLDVIITLWDCFVVDYADKVDVPIIHYLPVDASFTRKMYDNVKHAYRLVAFSKFGYSELLKWFPPSKISYIPHGIDTNVFKPQKDNDMRKKLHPAPVPDDAFLMIHVGANVGERKHIPQLIWVFKKLLEKHKDAYLYVYTNIQSEYPQGYDLIAYANHFGILKHLRYPDFNPILDPFEDEEMASLYSACDVYVSASMGEGFGLPLMESMACGTPCIVPKNSAQEELVQGHGWLAENVPKDVWFDVPVWIPNLQEYPVVNIRSLLDCMEDAYQNREKIEKYGRLSLEFARKYNWNQIMPLWFSFLKEVGDELDFFKSFA